MNMRTVATRAGVSSATVSRVINGSGLVTEATAKRVRAVLEELNFVPTQSATALKYGRSRTYGLMIPDICNPFFSEFLAAFEEELALIDHEMLLTGVQSGQGLLRSVRRLVARQVDGAVLMGSEMETREMEPLMRRIPMVTIDRRVTHPNCSDIAIDFEAGFRQAVLHLHALGHRRIGYIGGAPGHYTSHTRLDAFLSAMREAGLTPEPQWLADGDYHIAGGEKAATAMMRGRRPPTALLHANDLTAFGAALGLYRLGLRVPQDVSLIGCDDVLLAQVAHPPLTTIRIPRKRLARLCVDALEAAKQSEGGMGQQLSVTTELVVRESTVPPKPV